jgi:hypothetical protein
VASRAIRVTIGNVSALFRAVGYIIAAGLSREGWPFAVTVALGVLIPLALIWFPEEIDEWTQTWRNAGLTALPTTPSPPWMLRAMGWLFLVALPLFVLWNASRT